MSANSTETDHEHARRGWRNRLVRMGRLPAIMAITTFSAVASVLLVIVMFNIFNRELKPISLLFAIIVPSIVAPIASHYIVGLLVDLDKMHAELFHLAMRDSLTQVYNRRHFMQHLEIETVRAVRSSQPLSLLLIDADKFKEINDRHGHLVGDLALQSIAQACSASLRQYDVLARYGGEEFVVLLPATKLQQACEVAERIRVAVAAQSIEHSGKTIRFTVSLGVNSLLLGETDFAGMLARADSALYRAKDAGRNRWES